MPFGYQDTEKNQQRANATANILTQRGVVLRPFDEAFPTSALSHHFVGGVYAKETRLDPGWVLVSHQHPYDHLSILASGRVCLTVGDNQQYLTGPCALTIEAGKEHTLRAITPAVWFCIHATAETDPDKVDDAILTPPG